MSDSESSDPVEEKKRLAPSSSKNASGAPPLTLFDYSPKCWAIIGDTMPYSKQLEQLGGLYNQKLRCGAGWVFSRKKQLVLEHFIKTNEILTEVPKAAAPPKGDQMVQRIFAEFKGAFEPTAEYDGESIMAVIDQLEKKYFKQPEKITAKKK